MLVAVNYQLCMHLRVNLIDAQSLLACSLVSTIHRKSHTDRHMYIKKEEYSIEFFTIHSSICEFL